MKWYKKQMTALLKKNDKSVDTSSGAKNHHSLSLIKKANANRISSNPVFQRNRNRVKTDSK